MDLRLLWCRGPGAGQKPRRELCGFYLQIQVGISIGGPCAGRNKGSDRLVVGGIMPETCHVSGSSKNYSWNAEAGSGGDVLFIKVPHWDSWGSWPYGILTPHLFAFKAASSRVGEDVLL